MLFLYKRNSWHGCMHCNCTCNINFLVQPTVRDALGLRLCTSMTSMSQSHGEGYETFPWSLGVYDAHCHPTDTKASLNSIPSMQARALTVMATRAQDQQLVDELAHDQGLRPPASATNAKEPRPPGSIIPAFGWHPWFSHQLFDDTQSPVNHLTKEQKSIHYNAVLRPSPVDEDFLNQLPEPTPLSSHVTRTKERLQRHPLAMVGEVGLDRSFRLPKGWDSYEMHKRNNSLTPGGRECRGLSPYRVDMSHQTAILLAQLRLSGELQRPVSLHGVRCSGILFDTLAQTWKGQERKVSSRTERKRRLSVPHAHLHEDEQLTTPQRTGSGSYPPRICLHSYSGDPSFLKQYFNPTIPTETYVSFSIVINFGPQSKEWSTQSIKDVPTTRLLIESDLHIAGAEMDANLEAIARKVCQIRGWSLPEGVQQLASNWHTFIYGAMPNDHCLS